MRYQPSVTAEPTLRKKYRKLQRWNLLFRQIYGPPSPAFWGVDQWSDRLGGYFTRHGNRNFAVHQVSRMLRVVHRQLQQEGRSVWLLPIDHQSHQRPSFLYGNLRRRFPRRSAEAERRWIMRLRQRLLAARKGAEDQESQLNHGRRLLVNEANSFWQQRGFRRRVPLELAHHNIVALRWEDPDRLLLNPHFLRLMRPAVTFLRDAEGFPPAFRAGLFRQRQRLGQRFAQLSRRKGIFNRWQLRQYYWNHRHRQLQLRQLQRLRLRFRKALAKLTQLQRRLAAAQVSGTLESLQQQLKLHSFRAPTTAGHRCQALYRRLAGSVEVRERWGILRRLCGAALPPTGGLWLERQMQRTSKKPSVRQTGKPSGPSPVDHHRQRYRQRVRVLQRDQRRLAQLRGQLRQQLSRFTHRRRHVLRCTVPGRWLRRRLRRQQQRQNYRRYRRLRRPLGVLQQLQRRLVRFAPTGGKPLPGFSAKGKNWRRQMQRRVTRLRLRRRLRRRLQQRLRKATPGTHRRRPQRCLVHRRPTVANRRRRRVQPARWGPKKALPRFSAPFQRVPASGKKVRSLPGSASGKKVRSLPGSGSGKAGTFGTPRKTSRVKQTFAEFSRKLPSSGRTQFQQRHRRGKVQPTRTRRFRGSNSPQKLHPLPVLTQRRRRQILQARRPSAVTLMSRLRTLQRRENRLHRVQSRLRRKLLRLQTQQPDLTQRLVTAKNHWRWLTQLWQVSGKVYHSGTNFRKAQRNQSLYLSLWDGRQAWEARRLLRNGAVLLKNQRSWVTNQAWLRRRNLPISATQVRVLRRDHRRLYCQVTRHRRELRVNRELQERQLRDWAELRQQIAWSTQLSGTAPGSAVPVHYTAQDYFVADGPSGERKQAYAQLRSFRRRQRRRQNTLGRLTRQLFFKALSRRLLRRQRALLFAEFQVARRRRRSLRLFHHRLRQKFGKRFAEDYRLPQKRRHRLRQQQRQRQRRRLRRSRGSRTLRQSRTAEGSGKPWKNRRFLRQPPRLPQHMRRQRQRRRLRQRHRRRSRLLSRTFQPTKPVWAAPKVQKISTQSWKTLQRPLPRTLSFRYTTPGQRQTTGRWRFPATPALVQHRGRLKRLPFRRVPAALLPQKGEALRRKLSRSGQDRQRSSSRLPLVHYRVLELTIGDPTALDEDGNELPPERWLVLERSYGPVGYDVLMADLFGVLTPALRLMAKVVGHKSARRTVYHARDGVPLTQRRKLIFGWLRDLVNKNPDYNYLRRNTLRKRPSKRVLLRPERSRRLTEPFQSRLYAELHQLLQPDEPIMERLEDFDEKSHQLRLTRRHYRWD